MGALIADLRYGLRMLARSPGFSLMAVLALALGIGANTAIFSVVDAVVLRPLPYRDPGRLVMVWEKNPRGMDRSMVSPLNFLAWRERSRVFEQIAALHILPGNISGEGQPEQVWNQRVSASLFSILGTTPLLGRGFLPGEDGTSGDPIVVLSYGLWQRRFGGRADIVGRSLELNNSPYTIVGVMPPDFELPAVSGALADLWMPLRLQPAEIARSSRFLAVLARIKPEFSLAQARAEMETIAAQTARDAPERNSGWGVNLVPLEDQLTGEVRPGILVLATAVGLVLLIACANVANLLLARAAGRQREIAIRMALGAARHRILRQLLTESLLLSVLGGGAGTLLAFWGIRALSALPSGLPAARIELISMNAPVLVFTLVITLATGFIFGLAPAVTTIRTNLVRGLKEGGTSRGSAQGRRFRSYLVVSEIALALSLLVAAGLMIRTFAGLARVDAGFQPSHVLTMRLLLIPLHYRQPARQIAFYQDAVERFRALPGVTAAAAINFVPLTGVRSTTTYTILGRTAPPPGAKPVADVRLITPDYFRVMGIPLVKGRAFDDRDTASSPGVFIISENMARRQWPDSDPIGQKLRVDTTAGSTGAIVGIVRGVRHQSLRDEPEHAVYMPYPQNPLPFATFVLRTSSDPAAMSAAATREIFQLDKDQPVSDVRTMEEIVSAAMSRTRFSMLLLGVFAAAALALASVGIYGVMSYTVAQQAQEIGVRMALGAQQRDILRGVLRQTLALTAAGVCVGIAGAVSLTRAMSTLLYGVKYTDPATFGGVSLLLAIVSLSASYFPARRASRVDPKVALREE